MNIGTMGKISRMCCYGCIDKAATTWINDF